MGRARGRARALRTRLRRSQDRSSAPVLQPKIVCASGPFQGVRGRRWALRSKGGTVPMRADSSPRGCSPSRQTHATPGRHTAPLLSHVRTRRHLEVHCTSIGLVATRNSAALSNARPKRFHPSRWATRLADRGVKPRIYARMTRSLGRRGESRDGWERRREAAEMCSHIARRGLSHWKRLRLSQTWSPPTPKSSAHSRCARIVRRLRACFRPSKQGAQRLLRSRTD